MRPLACALLVLAAAPAFAKRGDMRKPSPLVAAFVAEAVVVGTVTGVETVTASPQRGAAEVGYRVLVVKVEQALYGVKGVTHVRVALTPNEAARPDAPKADGKYLFFLSDHPTANVLVPQGGHPTVDLAADKERAELLRRARAAASARTDPVKALRAEKKEDRVSAACALAMYYQRSGAGLNTFPPAPRGVEETERPAEESRLLLAALAEGEWRCGVLAVLGQSGDDNPYLVVFGLGLEKYGFARVEAAPRDDEAKVNQAAFKEWLAGKGKDARVKQLVPKK